MVNWQGNCLRLFYYVMPAFPLKYLAKGLKFNQDSKSVVHDLNLGLSEYKHWILFTQVQHWL